MRNRSVGPLLLAADAVRAGMSDESRRLKKAKQQTTIDTKHTKQDCRSGLRPTARGDETRLSLIAQRPLLECLRLGALHDAGPWRPVHDFRATWNLRHDLPTP